MDDILKIWAKAYYTGGSFDLSKAIQNFDVGNINFEEEIKAVIEEKSKAHSESTGIHPPSDKPKVEPEPKVENNSSYLNDNDDDYYSLIEV